MIASNRVGSLAAALVLAGGLGPAASASGPAAPSALRQAQLAVSRYFTSMDEGRGLAFCTTAISTAAREAEGGTARCVARMDGYVAGIRRRALPAAILDLKALFYMVSSGITTHCTGGGSCPVARYGLWAREFTAPGVTWRTGSNPRLASTVGPDVVAVVDPARSSSAWLTLYYQAPDGRILRASWSTTPGSWRGSVVDTHAGQPFVSSVRVLAAHALPDGSIDAAVSLRVGTTPTVERFRLVRENGTLRADSWTDVTSSVTS
jgi:hypothetical protein